VPQMAHFRLVRWDSKQAAGISLLSCSNLDKKEGKQASGLLPLHVAVDTGKEGNPLGGCMSCELVGTPHL